MILRRWWLNQPLALLPLSLLFTEDKSRPATCRRGGKEGGKSEEMEVVSDEMGEQSEGVERGDTEGR